MFRREGTIMIMIVAFEPVNEGVNEERPPTPPVFQGPDDAAMDLRPHASDGKLSYLDFFFILITDC